MQAYLAIIGHQTQLALAELQLLFATNIQHKNDHAILFDTQLSPDQRPGLSMSIKIGLIMPNAKIANHIPEMSLIGTAKKTTWIHRKKQLPQIKRFKTVDLFHTDKEIKEQGCELIPIDLHHTAVITHYQNIPLYEKIDYEKPVRGMQVGMMPTKLTHCILNLTAHLHYHEHSTPDSLSLQDCGVKLSTVYDPFCGFGTTNFLANTLGHHSIGSDRNITPAKQNLKRRNTTHPKITLFRQDILSPIYKPFLAHTDIIVTEGRLGNPTKKHPDPQQQKQTYTQVLQLYKWLFTSMDNYDIPHLTYGFCIPRYPKNTTPDHPGTQAITQLHNITQTHKLTLIDQDLIYHRPRQITARKILFAQK